MQKETPPVLQAGGVMRLWGLSGTTYPRGFRRLRRTCATTRCRDIAGECVFPPVSLGGFLWGLLIGAHGLRLRITAAVGV